jgi:hypothetical protein
MSWINLNKFKNIKFRIRLLTYFFEPSHSNTPLKTLKKRPLKNQVQKLVIFPVKYL